MRGCNCSGWFTVAAGYCSNYTWYSLDYGWDRILYQYCSYIGTVATVNQPKKRPVQPNRAFKAGDHPLDEQWLDSATVSEARGGAEETVCAATDAHARRRDPAGWPAVASRGWPPPLSIPRQGACVSDVMPLL